MNPGTDDSDDVCTRAAVSVVARELGDDPDDGFDMVTVVPTGDTAVSLPAAVPAAALESTAGSEKETGIYT